MCRHLTYVGPPVAMRSLLFDAPHALVHQARTPRRQHAGRDNPDGWGVAWGTDPVERYRAAIPMWEDTGFDGAPTTSSFMAAARYASAGSTRAVHNAAPFVSGRWMFSLNGFVSDFRAGFGEELRSELSPERAAGIEGDTDSEVVFALILDRLDAGATAGEAVSDVARRVLRISTGALNLLLTDGEEVAATAIGNSLFMCTGPGLILASEPVDGSESWVEIDNGSLVENDRVAPIGALTPREGPS